MDAARRLRAGHPGTAAEMSARPERGLSGPSGFVRASGDQSHKDTRKFKILSLCLCGLCVFVLHERNGRGRCVPQPFGLRARASAFGLLFLPHPAGPGNECSAGAGPLRTFRLRAGIRRSISQRHQEHKGTTKFKIFSLCLCGLCVFVLHKRNGRGRCMPQPLGFAPARVHSAFCFCRTALAHEMSARPERGLSGPSGFVRASGDQSHKDTKNTKTQGNSNFCLRVISTKWPQRIYAAALGLRARPSAFGLLFLPHRAGPGNECSAGAGPLRAFRLRAGIRRSISQRHQEHKGTRKFKFLSSC